MKSGKGREKDKARTTKLKKRSGEIYKNVNPLVKKSGGAK